MPLDHYVSQVHLKRFYSPALKHLMYATRKSDLKQITPDAKAVCRREEGNTNYHLAEPRAIEEFLKTIEGGYNRAVDSFETGHVDRESVYTVAGFTSYLLTCSPTAMRIGVDPLATIVEMTAKILDKQGRIPPPPPELEGASLTELLNSGAVRVGIDPKYPQAIGIQNIFRTLNAYGNFRWEVLINDHTDCPFFTSDFPVALQAASKTAPAKRIVPLSPTIAVRFDPQRYQLRQKTDFNFPNFSYESRRVGRREVVDVNRLLVQCAEDVVFYRDNRPWVVPFIEKNRFFRLDTEQMQLEEKGKVLLHSSQTIKPHSWD